MKGKILQRTWRVWHFTAGDPFWQVAKDPYLYISSAVHCLVGGLLQCASCALEHAFGCAHEMFQKGYTNENGNFVSPFADGASSFGGLLSGVRHRCHHGAFSHEIKRSAQSPFLIMADNLEWTWARLSDSHVSCGTYRHRSLFTM